MDPPPQYDPRYLAGIECFNRGDYFDAHEIWEDLWNDCPADYRRFYQSLIQAAVALYHWSSGNGRGARRLFHSGRTYMSAYPEPFLGLAIGRFWQEMELAVAGALSDIEPAESARLDAAKAPKIVLIV